MSYPPTPGCPKCEAILAQTPNAWACADCRYLAEKARAPSKADRFGQLFKRELDEWHERITRKEAELDRHGYGGRPPREDYVRTTAGYNGFTLEPAVEYRDGDDFRALTYELTKIAIDAANQSVDDQMHCARWAGERIAKQWPDRAYFIEVWQEGREGFAQIVQPYGFPRNR